MMDKVTHVVVGENSDESQVQEARELYEKPTITEQWVLTSAKLGKLAPVKPYDQITNGKFFSNFIFTMYKIDPQDRLKLYAMITLHGGVVQKELDNRVTHLLSIGAQSVAMKVAALTKNKLTITTPDWVVECLKQKKLVDSDAFHPNLLVTSMQQQSKITLMPAGAQEKTSLVRNQLQQNIRPSRPIIQSMQHTPQQINEIIQSQIQQEMQEKAKLAAAASSSSNQAPQSVPTTISQEPLTPNKVITQITPQKTAPVQQIQTVNTQVSINSSQGNNGGNTFIQQTIANQGPPNQVAPNNQMSMQRQISLQQIEANAKEQKIQLISQQLQQSTQNQQQLMQQQQFKQFQNNQMLANNQQVNQMNQNAPQQFAQQQNMQGNVQQAQRIAVQQGQGVTLQQAQGVSLQQNQGVTLQQNQGVSLQQNQGITIQQNQGVALQQNQGVTLQQGQGVPVQHQQFAGQQMKQIINPGQTQNQQQQQQFIMNQNAGGGAVKAIGQPGASSNGNNFIQIIQQGQGQQIIQIQHPEGGQMQQKVLTQHVSFEK
jgi:hypothetical protein